MNDDAIYVFNASWFTPNGPERYAEYLDAARPLVERLGGAFLHK